MAWESRFCRGTRYSRGSRNEARPGVRRGRIGRVSGVKSRRGREGLWAGLVSLEWMGRYAEVPHIGYLASVATVGVASALAAGVTHLVTLPNLVVLIFMSAVLMSAILWGRGPSFFAAILSVAVLTVFFYRPTYGLRVAEMEDLFDLALFLIVAFVCSDIAAHVRLQAIEARRREALMERLYAFSRRLAGIADPEELFATIAAHLREVLRQPVALLLQSEDRLSIAAAAPSDLSFLEEDLQSAEALWSQAPNAPLAATLASGWTLRTLRSGHTNVAILAARTGGAGAAMPVESGYLDSLLDQAAVAIERTQLVRAYEDARVQAKTDSLREALINSISHDLQTPLASILGSATALQSFGTLYDSKGRAELVDTIHEEAERLNHIIGNILDLSRIRAGQVSPRFEFVELADIVNAALHRARKRLADHRVTVAVPATLPMLKLDLFLLEHALVNLLENAAKYAPKGTRIDLRAVQSGGSVMIEVSDFGAGIASQDLDRIFDRFFRAVTHDARPAGAGLGLTICRAFVEANGGQIEASSPGPGKGATFRITLPVPEAGVSLDTAVQDE